VYGSYLSLIPHLCIETDSRSASLGLRYGRLEPRKCCTEPRNSQLATTMVVDSQLNSRALSSQSRPRGGCPVSPLYPLVYGSWYYKVVRDPKLWVIPAINLGFCSTSRGVSRAARHSSRKVVSGVHPTHLSSIFRLSLTSGTPKTTLVQRLPPNADLCRIGTHAALQGTSLGNL